MVPGAVVLRLLFQNAVGGIPGCCGLLAVLAISIRLVRLQHSIPVIGVETRQKSSLIVQELPGPVHLFLVVMPLLLHRPFKAVISSVNQKPVLGVISRAFCQIPLGVPFPHSILGQLTLFRQHRCLIAAPLGIMFVNIGMIQIACGGIILDTALAPLTVIGIEPIASPHSIAIVIIGTADLAVFIQRILVVGCQCTSSVIGAADKTDPVTVILPLGPFL